MEADFSGWATKAGLKCTDGRTIMPNAFQHQDQTRVPLVWQHGHDDPENVLGHAILENRPEGVYAYGFFNNSPKATSAKGLVEHKDINSMSIWANQLIERSGNVLHGAIREVSLVLSGANPGALIENVAIRHSDGEDTIVDDEAIIYTGLELEHSDIASEATSEVEETQEVVEDATAETEEIQHAESEELTAQEVLASMTEEQQKVVALMVSEASASGSAEHAAMADTDTKPEATQPADSKEPTVQDIYDSMNEEQQTVLHFMIGEALDSAKQSAIDDSDSNNTSAESGIQEGNETMKHNVFETEAPADAVFLSHDDVKGIVADAIKVGSMKSAVENYALSHGITNIDQLFPEAMAIDSQPEWLSRRMEWVDKILGSVRKSPFSRIKTLSADITAEQARAKGYIKGNIKKDEFFTVAKRVTTPSTIYKKQKLDRDDVLDITDFDIIAWLKGEMRLMLDEEIAVAVLLGDGRDVSHEDKINETNIRPIAKDHELYTTTVNVNISDALSSVSEIIDAIITNRKFYKGTGLPVFFTTETYLAMFLLLKDTTGRRIYKDVAEIATELRVSEIVTVEAMERDTTLIGVLVNPVDYNIGADRGGEINMFDDFDIDYNQQKYLIETRISGALIKLKSAIALRKVDAAVTLISPTAPTFVSDTGVITIPTQTGVVYKNVGGTTLSAGPQTALAAGASLTVYAFPSSGSYAFNTTEEDTWTFTRESV